MRKFAYFVIATSLALAGCGGSGTGTSGSGGVTLGALNGVATSFTASCFDGTTQTSTVSQAAADGLCPAKSTIVNDPLPVASTYAADSEELAAFNLLNQERSRCGFGTLKQNSALDTAAQNHVVWQFKNWNYIFSGLSHSEARGTNGFTGFSPGDRAIFAGYELGGIADEIAGTVSSTKIGQGIRGVRQLMNAPYHMRGLLDGYRDVGVSVKNGIENGFSQIPYTITQFDLAYTPAAKGTLQSSTEVLTYPCNGTTETDYKLSHEIPNPVPGRDLRKNPLGGSVFVLLRYGNKLAFTSATMTQVSGDGAGTAVTLRDPVTSANSGNAFQSHQGYIVADAPLEPNTQYEVVINGTNNGTPFTRQFTFTTGTGG